MRLNICILFFSLAGMLFAQEPEKDWEARKEEWKAQKVAFFTQKMNLDSKTAEKFWPIYNEYEHDRFENHRAFKDVMNDMQNIDDAKTLSDAEYLKLSERLLDVKKQQLSMEEKYLERFKEVLSPKQLVLFYKAEDQFGKEMLRRFRGKQRNTPE